MHEAKKKSERIAFSQVSKCGQRKRICVLTKRDMFALKLVTYERRNFNQLKAFSDRINAINLAVKLPRKPQWQLG